jgi:hypothetical protein
MTRGAHLTPDGLQKIVSIKASMNSNGLSDVLKAEFPDVIPVPRPLVVDKDIKDPNWVAGFVDGEGCFFIDIYKTGCFARKQGLRLNSFFK